MLNLQSVKEPTGALSENFLLALKTDFPTTTFVVLGATSGGIAEIGRAVFPIVHSIEYSWNSVSALKKAGIAGPTLFWVDAYSLSGSAISSILRFLSIDFRNSFRGSAIVIDGLSFLDSKDPKVNLAEAGATFAELEYQFYILGDTGLALSKHSDLKVSPLIQALTISRLYDNNNLEITELFAAEEVIMQAEGAEREFLRALPMSHLGGYANSLHYKFWSALSRLGQCEFIAAERELASAVHDGFNHWRLGWYFAKIFVATGKTTKAKKALEDLAVLAPDFTPALDLIAEFSTRGSSLHITPTIDHAFPMMWKQMQECYLRVLRNLEADGIDKHDLDFVHPSWKGASEAIRGILMGPSDNFFLHHPVVSGMMLRQGFGISQEYEETYLRNCLKSDIREKISSFVESPFGSLEKDCKSFNCSANTLWNLYYAARTSELFDKDQFKFIIEFGGGYGNLALVYKHLNPEATIVIIDLPEMLALQYLFLSSNIDRCSISVHEKAGMPIKPNSINLVPVFYIDSIQQVAELFISTFALSETPVAMQDRVFRRKFFNAENVYITGQFPEASDEHDWVGQAQLHESVRRQYSYVVSLPFHVFKKGVKLYEIAGTKRFNEVDLAPKELVTIYVPSYNSEKYLAATLESILAQSYRHFEVIVVNDGSMDRTKDIAEAFSKIDNRVRVVSHAVNLGLSAARNTGWMNASPSSSYIMNHDSDDISHPNKLRALVEHLQSNADIDAVGCFAEYFNDNNQVVGNPPIKWEKNKIRASFGIVNSMVISASLVRREMYEKIAPFRSEFGGCDDYDFWARALLNGYTLANIPCVMHGIRVHPSSMGATQHQEMELVAIKIRHNYNTQIQVLKVTENEVNASIHTSITPKSEGKKSKMYPKC